MNPNYLGIVITIAVVITAALVDLGVYLHQHNNNHERKLAKSFSPLKFPIGNLRFWALGDRVLVEEDEFRTGYECPKCDGRGQITCDNCQGTQQTSTGKKCSICDGTDGHLTCPECKGKGGLLIAPEIAERRPTTGKVVSIGYKVNVLKPGDAVMYSSFAGFVVDLERAGHSVCLRILHEPEIFCGLEGHLTLSNFKGKSDISVYNK